MKSRYRPIGEYIRLVDKRNNGLNVKKLLGLTISKKFISSVANIIGTDMKKYKIIRRNQFACSIMQVRRDKKMPVALLQEYDEAIISQAYPVFEIKDGKKLLPEYLMMWFERSEFDREACFYAVGGVRGSLEWTDFCEMKLPVPSIEKQQQIIDEYNTIQNRIKLNEQIIQKLEETAQAIYKQWFVEGIENVNILLGDILKPRRGKSITREQTTEGKYPVIAGGIEPSCFHNKFNTQSPVITVSASGANAGFVNIHFDKVWASDCSYIDNTVFDELFFIYVALKNNQSLLMSKQFGTGQPHIYPAHIMSLELSNISPKKIKDFNSMMIPFFGIMKRTMLENTLLNQLLALLLSKLATIEN